MKNVKNGWNLEFCNISKTEIICKTEIIFASEGIDLLENQVKEAKQMVEESDIKYDEVARKLAMVK